VSEEDRLYGSVTAQNIVDLVNKGLWGVEQVKRELDIVSRSNVKKITRELNQYCAGANTPCGWCECCRVNRVINFGKLLDANMKEIKNAEPVRYPRKSRRSKKGTDSKPTSKASSRTKVAKRKK